MRDDCDIDRGVPCADTESDDDGNGWISESDSIEEVFEGSNNNVAIFPAESAHADDADWGINRSRMFAFAYSTPD